jgi:L-threonylcarbamoyladenylate synthase
VAGGPCSGRAIPDPGGPARRWRPGEPLAPLAEIVARGGVLAIPTESSYGLAVDPRNPEGVARVYRVKAREAGKPLPVVVAGVEQLALLGVDPDEPETAAALAVLTRVWPAPLTAVLPLSRPGPRPLPAAAGGATVAVRVPAHEPLRRLLEALGTPLTATSANPAGEPPVLEPEAAAALLAGEDAAVVDGGSLPGGPPSTLVVWRSAGGRTDGDGGGFDVLRAGAFPAGRLRDLEARPGPEGGEHRIR